MRLTDILKIADRVKTDKRPSRTQFTDNGNAELVVNQNIIDYVDIALKMEDKLREAQEVLPTAILVIESMIENFKITGTDDTAHKYLLKQLNEWLE